MNDIKLEPTIPNLKVGEWMHYDTSYVENEDTPQEKFIPGTQGMMVKFHGKGANGKYYMDSIRIATDDLALNDWDVEKLKELIRCQFEIVMMSMEDLLKRENTVLVPYE